MLNQLSRRGAGLLAALAVIALGSGVGGCGSPPQATASNFAVFTTLHVLSAEISSDLEGLGDEQTFSLNGPFTAAHMRRFFETSPDEYAKGKIRMDEMLEGQQRRSTFFQAIQTRLRADVAASFAQAIKLPTTRPTTKPSDGTGGDTDTADGAAGAGGGSTTQPTSRPTADLANAGELESYRKSFEAELKAINDDLAKAAASDSPFDRLDRVADFYAAYVVKSLRVRGDSRSIDPVTLKDAILNSVPNTVTGQAIKQELEKRIKKLEGRTFPTPSGLDPDRLLLVIFQTHVDPGTRPDFMTGVRIQITGGALRGGKTDPAYADAVKVIRVHPTRFYDVDTVDFGESTRQELALSGAFNGVLPQAGTNIDAKIQNDKLLESDQRRKFLSRINKVGSFSDAATHTIGFNFYPNNVVVEATPLFSRIMGFLFFTPRDYETRSYLEGGARDCAALVVVPRNLASFTCRVGHVSGNINGGKITDTQWEGGAFTVTLPPWDNIELLSATLGAAPTPRPARAATTQPTSRPAPDAGRG
jgi:hypothetical protein